MTLSPARSKARSNRSHAVRRAKERYNLDLSADDVSAIESMIRDDSPHCKRLRVSANGQPRDLYAVRYGEKWLPIFFDRDADSILTVLPPHALDRFWRTAKSSPHPPSPAFDVDLPKINGASSVGEIERAIAEVNRRRKLGADLLATLGAADVRRKRANKQLSQLAGLLREFRFRREIAALRAKVNRYPSATLGDARRAILSLVFRCGAELTPDERSALEAIEAALAPKGSRPETD